MVVKQLPLSNVPRAVRAQIDGLVNQNIRHSIGSTRSPKEELINCPTEWPLLADFDEKVIGGRNRPPDLEVGSNESVFLELNFSKGGLTENHSNEFLHQVFVRTFSSVSALTAIAGRLALVHSIGAESCLWVRAFWQDRIGGRVLPAGIGSIPRRAATKAVTSIMPAGHCKKFLAEKFPQADKSYSFEYGDKASRERGVQALKDTVQGLRP